MILLDEVVFDSCALHGPSVVHLGEISTFVSMTLGSEKQHTDDIEAFRLQWSLQCSCGFGAMMYGALGS
jgi:hypothetical protein